MVKLSEEIRNNIINDLQNNISTIDIVNNRNVSKTTVYRINKELRNGNVSVSNLNVKGDNNLNEKNGYK